MKKKILILFLSIMLTFSFVMAEDNMFFKIDLPTDYILTTKMSGTYQWVNEKAGSNYVVSMKLRTEEATINDLDDSQKKKVIDSIINTLKEQYYNTYKQEVKVDIVYHSEKKFGKYNSLGITLKIKNFLSTGHDMNQYINVIDSDHYIYTVFYSTTDEKYDANQYDKAQKSFIIKDDMIRVSNFEKIKYGSIAVGIFLLGYIISSLKNKISKKNRFKKEV